MVHLLHRLYGVDAPAGSVVGRMNEVTLRRARLVLGWVTVCERVSLAIVIV